VYICTREKKPPSENVKKEKEKKMTALYILAAVLIDIYNERAFFLSLSLYLLQRRKKSTEKRNE
jgi:hypothetical protein